MALASRPSVGVGSIYLLATTLHSSSSSSFSSVLSNQFIVTRCAIVFVLFVVDVCSLLIFSRSHDNNNNKCERFMVEQHATPFATDLSVALGANC
jgi:hypothetical protein